jgi:bacillithiol biosynthesis cysteine-adding enzyme BshC
VKDAPAVAGFLPPVPRTDGEWEALLASVAAEGPRVPPEAARALADRQDRLGAGASARENALRLGTAEAPALAVVTGQQPGLLGGPLLTFHKAAGAIHLARRLDALGVRRVVPVFWLASEDHDVEEANQATVLDREGQPHRLSLDVKGDGRSLADLHVPREASDALLARLAALLPDTDRAREALRGVAREGDEPFADWCARCLLRVFGDQGLVVVDPRWAAPRSGASLAWLAEHAEPIRRSVLESGARLREAGLPDPLEPGPEDAPLFLRAAPGGPRLRVSLRGDGSVLLRGAPSPLGRDALAALLRREPLRGSPDAAGRVFVQNALLPVAAYVAGPTEIAYHAQLRRAHEDLGLRFPLPVPRPSATWVDAKSEATAAAFGLDVERVLAGAKPAAAPAPPGAAAFVAETRAALEEVRRRAALLGPAAGGAAAARAAVERLAAAWAKAEPAILAAFEADEAVGRGRWTRLTNFLFPRGKPQERTLAPVSLTARYGTRAVREGLATLDPLAPGPVRIRLEDAP